MIRYTSPPDVDVDVGHRGHVTWETFRRVLEIDAEHTARFFREVLETSPGLYAPGSTPTRTVLQGTVTQLVPGSRMTVRVGRDDSDKAVTLFLVAGSGSLVGELVSQFNDSRRGVLLTPDVPAASASGLFPLPLPEEETAAPPRRAPAAPTPPAPPAPPRRPGIPLDPGPPAVGEAFQKPWARLNRHLRRHGGRASALHLRELTDAQRAFLELLFSGPLAALEADARADIEDFYAADDGRRPRIHTAQLSLPTEPGGAWTITLGEAAWGGVVVVYSVVGWEVTDRTLVG